MAAKDRAMRRYQGTVSPFRKNTLQELMELEKAYTRDKLALMDRFNEDTAEAEADLKSETDEAKRKYSRHLDPDSVYERLFNQEG